MSAYLRMPEAVTLQVSAIRLLKTQDRELVGHIRYNSASQCPLDRARA